MTGSKSSSHTEPEVKIMEGKKSPSPNKHITFTDFADTAECA